VAKKNVKTDRVADAVRGAGAPLVHTADPAPKKVPARRKTPVGKGGGAKSLVARRLRPPRATAEVGAIRDATERRFDAILQELRGVKRIIEQIATPPSEIDAALDASVDSLRRLLSELIEQRMESVVRDLVDIRREAASLAGRDWTRIVARLDELLEGLGAVRFEAEPMDVVDPLIHVVVDERQQANVPDGVILETLRPGYRTARGLVVCKAAVTVNQRQ
jgi:hypothetical protein